MSKITADDVHVAVTAQPLIGVTLAAELLGIRNENMGRLRDSGRLPREVQIEGAGRRAGQPGRAYVRSEIEALARELAAEERGADGRRLPGRRA